MAAPVDLMLADLKQKYAASPTSSRYSRLYNDQPWGHMFAVLHKGLNEHFSSVNNRAETTRHYWADNSRQLIDLIADVESGLHVLDMAGVKVELSASYEEAMERCRPWLSPSGGSTVPEGFAAIEIVEYEPIFTVPATSVKLEKGGLNVEMAMVGEGSYARVYSYVDPDYGTKFALKRAKRDLTDRELERFQFEFDVMKRLSFPYLVEVYRYDERKNEYRMEYCDTTIRDYIKKNNGKISFTTRKRIALQFLYGMNYLHSKKILHRDVSLQNILLKLYDSPAVLVKISDFGLVKDSTNQYTRTQTEMKGTIRDPSLDSFKDYSVANEIYSIGHILAYIFTGKESLPVATSDVGRIVHRCVANDQAQRYGSVAAVIAEVDQLEAQPNQATS